MWILFLEDAANRGINISTCEAHMWKEQACAVVAFQIVTALRSPHGEGKIYLTQTRRMCVVLES